MPDAHADILVPEAASVVSPPRSPCREGCSVILTEETDWLGGQLTSPAVSSY